VRQAVATSAKTPHAIVSRLASDPIKTVRRAALSALKAASAA
jgi:hypothetical protein